jgi:hypothetical protein
MQFTVETSGSSITKPGADLAVGPRGDATPGPGAGGSPAAAGFRLHQNVPNPFNARTTIRFDLATRAGVRLSVYDVAGREVVRLVDGERPGGPNEVVFDAHGLPSGVYFYRLRAGAFAEKRRLMLLK